MQISKHLFLATVFFTIASIASAQVPRFTKYKVGESGASAYFPAAPEWELTYSEDSSEVYTAEVELGGVHYGSIVVKLSSPQDNDPEEWETMLISYMEFLNKSAFELVSTVDFGKGHKLESHPSARGVIQYGKDKNGNQFSDKGWVDQKMIAVMFIYSEKEVNLNYQTLFFDGFRFPEK